MARAFSSGVDEEYRPILTSAVEAEECAILIDQMDQLIALLTRDEPELSPAADLDPFFTKLGLGDLFNAAEEDSGSVLEEPVSARLFPPGYLADETAARDFRRFTEAELRQQKIETAQFVRGTIEAAADTFPPEVVLTPDEAMAWLRGLNDLRLTIAVQVGIGEPDELDRLASPEIRTMRELYDFLTWWQGSLLEVLN